MSKIRLIKDGRLAEPSKFNIHSVNEIIVCWPDEQDMDFMDNYEVFIESEQRWMTFHEAFRDHHLIVDNYNTHFFEPTCQEDKLRGYTL